MYLGSIQLLYRLHTKEVTFVIGINILLESIVFYKLLSNMLFLFFA